MRFVATLFVLLSLALPASILVGIPYLVVYPDRYPIEMTPAEVDLPFEDVTLHPADVDINLEGWWMPAENANATMLFLHGGSSNRHTSYFRALQFYKAMTDQGINVLAIDLRNHGASGSTDEGLQFGASEWHDAVAGLDWLAAKGVQGPTVLMGISMGGATVVHAGAKAPDLKADGLILCDPLLDTANAGANAIRAEAGIPPSLGGFAMLGAHWFYGLPRGEDDALALGASITKPTLLIQDPQDPVTLAFFSKRLADSNQNVTLVMMPEMDLDDPRLEWKGAWGAHVGAYEFHPDETVAAINGFIDTLR